MRGSARVLPAALLLLLVCLAGQVSCAAEWAKDMCSELTVHFPNFNAPCEACVEKASTGGDPTRCHTCLKGHAGHHQPEDLMTACLECVPLAETKRLGWACAQYCTHHGIIANGAQANECVGCLMADFPTDKWSCHVCMEQVPIVGDDMAARNECFGCVQDAQNAYHCAACARVPGTDDRKKCYDCMKAGTPGKTCAKQYGIGEWSNASMRENKSIQEFMEKLGIDTSHLKPFLKKKTEGQETA